MTTAQQTIGQAPKHDVCENGMDEIDRWAMGVGNAEKRSKSFSVRRPGTGKSFSRQSMKS